MQRALLSLETGSCCASCHIISGAHIAMLGPTHIVHGHTATVQAYKGDRNVDAKPDGKRRWWNGPGIECRPRSATGAGCPIRTRVHQPGRCREPHGGSPEPGGAAKGDEPLGQAVRSADGDRSYCDAEAMDGRCQEERP